MDRKSFGAANPDFLPWLENVFQPEDERLRLAREAAEAADLPPIQVNPFDALHLEVLARACGARKIVEIGTLAGYSGIALAKALPDDGTLFTFEFDPKHASVARENFKNAGFEKQVRLFEGAALDHLSQIESEGPFDLVFIDADKVNYPLYLKWAQTHLRKGGLVIGDNTFAFGDLHLTEFVNKRQSDTVTALQRFNEQIARSGAFRGSPFPTGEGLTVGVKL